MVRLCGNLAEVPVLSGLRYTFCSLSFCSGIMELPADAVWRRNLWILISTIFQINCPDETKAEEGGRGGEFAACAARSLNWQFLRL